MVTSGMRNSLLLAPMPTASTAQILGNNESTEPFTSNMYVSVGMLYEWPPILSQKGIGHAVAKQVCCITSNSSSTLTYAHLYHT